MKILNTYSCISNIYESAKSFHIPKKVKKKNKILHWVFENKQLKTCACVVQIKKQKYFYILARDIPENKNSEQNCKKLKKKNSNKKKLYKNRSS